jgi:hypothetical protein
MMENKLKEIMLLKFFLKELHLKYKKEKLLLQKWFVFGELAIMDY